VISNRVDVKSPRAVGKFWIPVVAALSLITMVLYGTALLAFLGQTLIRRGRRPPPTSGEGASGRSRIVPLLVVVGAALGAAAIAEDVMAAVAVLALTAVLDLAISGGRGTLVVIRSVLPRIPPSSSDR
jgi:hypothetical protein